MHRDSDKALTVLFADKGKSVTGIVLISFYFIQIDRNLFYSNDNNECIITKIKMIKHVPSSDKMSVLILGVLLDQDLTLVDHIKSLQSKLQNLQCQINMFMYILI